MNAIDGTDRHATTASGPPPSLLTIVLDTNPFAWDHLSPTFSLSAAIAHLLIFINAHLAINHANRVSVIASHTNCARWLYPTPSPPLANRNGPSRKEATDPLAGESTDVEMADVEQTNGVTTVANKYRPFHAVEQELLRNLHALLTDTPPASLSDHPTTTMIAGALTTALTYISKTSLAYSPAADAPFTSGTSSTVADVANDGHTQLTAREGLTSRILVLSVSGDLAAQYIPVMNAIFAAQRQRVPIDIVKLAGDTVFLQQASDATGGIYMAPKAPQGLLQYLMLGFLADPTARAWLVPCSAGGVDFRAACFCHRNVVTTGFVCSVCLSIFCQPLPDSICLTCGSHLQLPASYSVVPAVIPRKKKKKKRDATQGGSGTGTPAGVGTPVAGPG